MIRLTGKQQLTALDAVRRRALDEYITPDRAQEDDALCAAQLKRVAEEIGKMLVKYSVIDGKLSHYVDGTVPFWALPNVDWQSLLEEVKE